ncbi:MAG: Rrf2 family transcriptional regulator [Candidatus Kerfeldbacteria bacterium RIFOXYA2_FULL_38_24]|uniref:Rrf2 family transcriptional regulator n=1 Tax=Candidatus Kerfeldbacteria bacterium RIFOXYB2_FULL_38_14 TaxID=1798547 RepID=A0A1G2BG07_9BACT|nr:MAG: Rrf2 family transcriptional regulator [Candidatus Kerfeldbacteria bacterium RIFOXYA2_FULL_38_24]OGY88121.1 MAG: Rrf2 family transcriptional regulator [Candidatus Kerfeldbacteria bacterium RIFOXYB2_FULL_38_14]OGY89603.1 MAG: Rrf2 family transcriptional regulator [Candidatus Kerfeldbacteria bacterium RIFOXYC2_FULL_38_9]
MKLTTKSEYSLLALIYIARHQDGHFIKVEDICEKYNLTKKYLEHLLGVLKQSRYIKTKRGSHGGYRLAKPANKISIAEIIRLMDGALAPTESVSEYFFSQTALSQEKKMLVVFKDIRDYISKKLEKMKLSDLI